MSCRLGMNDSVWRIHGIVLTGGKEELDENPVHVALSTTNPNMERHSLQKTTKNHANYGAVNTCPVQVGLQEGTVGPYAGCCAHKCNTAPSNFLVAIF